MAAEIDFARLPRQPVPRFVVSPRRMLADVLSKGWVESIIPFLALLCVVIGIVLTTDDYFAASNLRNLAQYAADGGLVVLALLIVVAVGGIDLSVGSNFAMSAFAALFCFHILELPVPGGPGADAWRPARPSAPSTASIAGLLGCGALLTTLGTMITARGLFTLASQAQLVEISTSARIDDLWDWIGFEKVLTLPVGFWALVAGAALVFVMFRQTRFGWHVLAVGGNRKAARHGGIRVRTTVFLAYALAGLIVGLAGFLFAARQNSVGADTGIGMEFFVLTALVVGLGGFVPGRGAVVSVLIGFATIYILNNAMINAGYPRRFRPAQHGRDHHRHPRDRREVQEEPAPAAGFDLSRSRRLRCRPGRGHEGADAGRRRAEARRGQRSIAAGRVDGPEDVLLDAEGNIYCGNRDGRLLKIAATDHSTRRGAGQDRRPAAGPGFRPGRPHRRLRGGHGAGARDPGRRCRAA